MVDQTYIITLAPEFSNETTARVNFIIGLATNWINAPFWPANQLDMAIGLLTCHILKAIKTPGVGGIANEKVGDLSRGFHQPAFKFPLGMTQYGLLLELLIESLLITPLSFGSGIPAFTTTPIPLNWPD